MAEITATPSCAGTNATRFKEAVCVEANRVFDSCSDRDCLEDLQVFMTEAGQAVIDQSSLVKFKSAEVLDVFLSVEPVPFNRGFFAVDLTFYFRVSFGCSVSPVSTPVNARGLASHTKRVILFGGDGGVKTFLSSRSGGVADAMPVACVKTVEPMTLSCRLADMPPAGSEPLLAVPDSVAAGFDSPLILDPPLTGKFALVTIGAFSIVTLHRPVEIMVPSYDYVLPEKDCTSVLTADDPCETFRRMRFPAQQFFPDNLNEADCSCD